MLLQLTTDYMIQLEQPVRQQLGARTFGVCCGLALVLGACGTQTGRLSTATRDSSGVVIAESGDPALADSGTWLVDTIPFLTIGGGKGQPPDHFRAIGGMHRYSTGDIAVLDAATMQVRFFDATGAPLRSSRPLTMPAALTAPPQLLAYDTDSLLVISPDGASATRLAADGIEWLPLDARQVSPDSAGTRRIVGAFGDGSLLVAAMQTRCAQSGTTGFCEDSARVRRISSSGEELADFGVFPWRRTRTMLLASGGYLSLSRYYPQIHVAVSDRYFYYVDGARFEVQVYDAAGSLTRIVRAHPRPQPALRPDMPAEGPFTSASSVARIRELRDSLAVVQLPESATVVSGMLIDALGNIWLRRHVDSDTALTTESWWVADTSGRIVQRIATRGRFPDTGVAFWILPPASIYRWRGEIGSDFVLGAGRDPSGNESVRLYRLHRAAAPPG